MMLGGEAAGFPHSSKVPEKVLRYKSQSKQSQMQSCVRVSAILCKILMCPCDFSLGSSVFFQPPKNMSVGALDATHPQGHSPR